MSSLFNHCPVLSREVLEALQPKSGLLYVDGTVGGAGHALSLVKAQPDIRLIAFDRDPLALNAARQRLPETVQFIHDRFSAMGSYLAPGRITGGVLLDIGVSSPQLDEAERGFSFRLEGPLDMRMSQTGQTAAEWLAAADEADLVHCFKTYGEERLARPIARAIVDRSQALETTTQLADLVSQVYRRYRIREDQHPATRVFQALRIQINGELEELQIALDSLPNLLACGARIAVITFHSLEDRVVKQWMAHQAAKCVCPPRLPICQCGKTVTLKLITRKPITAGPDELKSNPRSRSAKLRVAEWL